MKGFLFTLTLLIFSTGSIFAQKSSMLEVKEYVLENGLTVLINEDHSLPKVFGAVVVKAGAKESPNTGIAHYFEHIMFKGTEKIGTIDYQSEKIYLDSIATKYEELSSTKDNSARSEIQKEINRLSIKAADYAIPNEFARLISKYGGSKLNAFTGYDVTAYHSEFTPQYFKQWAAINSERFINPVFRLFQSELETVYEEKNMYYDQLGSQAMERLFERVFNPHPYMYPIIGSTENLKNPNLSTMKQFYEDYYVAGNMVLIISGDVETDEIMPDIKECFGRIRSGVAPKKEPSEPDFFKGKESFQVNFPIPIVKAGGYVWKGVPLNHPDEIPVMILSRLLNNTNSTGMLDKLMADQKLLATFILNLAMNDAGAIALIVIPKLVFQPLNKAMELVESEIDKIKRGEISENEIEYIKTEIKRDNQRVLENLDSRARKMIDVVSSGISWNEYLTNLEKIDEYTKDDIVKIANKYLTEDHLYFTKKTGNYPKDLLPKPGFDPILPKNTESSSQYASQLELIETQEGSPAFIDFVSDATHYEINGLTSLYHVNNPVNNIFSLTISFRKGTTESKLLDPLSSYLTYLGTNGLSFEEFRGELQKLGSTMDFSATHNSFNIFLTGLDSNIEKSLELLKIFLNDVKGDQKKIKQIVEYKQLEDKGIKESPDNLADALYQWVTLGESSPYLNRLSASEIKKLSSDELLDEFQKIQRVKCDIHYCGNLPYEEIRDLISESMNVGNITMDTNNPVVLDMNEYHEPTLFFINSPKAKQSVIRLYLKGEVNNTVKERSAARLFSSYFGGNMSSIVFQEVREFRSLAYRASVNYLLNKDQFKPGILTGTISTQAEKSVEAIRLLDSLIGNMPVRGERVENAKQEMVNQINSNYPSFRNITSKIASFKEEGYLEDPNKQLYNTIKEMNIGDIEQFFIDNIKGKSVVYMVVGDEKSIDMKELERFGRIIKIKPEQVYK